MKLRKWLRDRRITGFEQLGFDRVVHFEFGHQNPSQILHLYVEFYASVYQENMQIFHFDFVGKYNID